MAFYRNTIVLEILSDDGPVEGDAVLETYDPAMSGGYSGTVLASQSDEVSPEQMAQLLSMQGSDPAFFGIGEED